MSNSVTPFVILFQARSGSTFLISTLDRHPEIQAHGEILVGMDAHRQRTKALGVLRPDDAFATGIKAVGLKCKFHDISDFGSFGEMLQEIGARVIFLYRQNSVKRAVSMLNAIRLEEATGFWNLHKEEDRLGPFTVDPNDFDVRLRKMDASLSRDRDQVESLELPTLTLTYEDILKDIGTTTSRILPFLGVSDQPIKGRTLKTTSDDLRLVIANFDDLRSRYVGTCYESMFDEVLVRGA